MDDGFSETKESAGQVCETQARENKKELLLWYETKAKGQRKVRQRRQHRFPFGFSQRCWVFFFLALGMMAMLIYSGLSWKYGSYALCVDGEAVCVISDHNKGRAVIDEYLEDVRSDHGGTVDFKEKVRLEQGFYRDLPVASTDSQFLSYVKNATHLQMPAVTVVADGEPLVTLKDRETAEAFLSEVKDTYKEPAVPAAAKVASVEIKQDLDIQEEVAPVEEVVEERAAVAMVCSTKADTPGLEVETVYEYNETVPIKPEVKVVPDNNAVIGRRVVAEEGKEGAESRRVRAVAVNGEVVETTIVQRQVVTEPGTTIIREGTRSALSLASRGDSSGSTIPILGQVSAKFGDSGPLWRSAHTGLDLAAPEGTPIYAVAAGKVTFAGWNKSYGNLVIVDIGNGVATYYGHQSKVVVDEGDAVARGDKLGECGSTGNTSGSHLHFEVRVNDEPVDPQTSGLI